MSEQLFREVKCIDRLPDKDGAYWTDLGSTHFFYHIMKWDVAESHITPDFWVEPVALICPNCKLDDEIRIHTTTHEATCGNCYTVWNI